MARTSLAGRRWPRALLIVAGCLLIVGLAVARLPHPDAAPPPLRLTGIQAGIITEMVSVFQNDNALVQYGSIDNRFDGNGLVAGRDGFSTAGGDMVQVVEAYLADRPDSPLAAFAPTMKTLAATGSDDVSGLTGLDTAWRRAADDPTFRAAQDRVDQRLYFAPPLARARALGLRTALGLAIIYDSAVQHGLGTGPDSLGALIETTSAALRGDPAGGVAETAWLAAFLNARAADLRNPADNRRQGTWSASEGRAFALGRLLSAGNLALNIPVNVNPYGTPHVLFPLGAGGVPTGPAVPAPSPDPASPGAGAPTPGVRTAPPSTVVSRPARTAVSSTEGLRAALAAAAPGQTITLADGTYAGNFTLTASGTASQPITLTGSAAAILTSTGYGLHVVGSYWRLNGFTVTRSLKGIVLDGASHTDIDSVTIHDITQEGIHLRYGSSDNTLRGLRLYNIPQAGVIIGASASGWIGGVPDRSDRNSVTGATFGPGITDQHIQVYEGSTGDTIAGNSFNGTGITSGGAWVDIRGNNVEISGNSGTTAPADGFQTHTEAGGWGCGIDFTANRADVRADGYGFRIDTRTGCTNTVHANNTVLHAAAGVTNIKVTP